MSRRALHLAEHCLTMPGDASRAAENGSRFGSRSGALAPLQRPENLPLHAKGAGCGRSAAVRPQGGAGEVSVSLLSGKVWVGWIS